MAIKSSREYLANQQFGRTLRGMVRLRVQESLEQEPHNGETKPWNLTTALRLAAALSSMMLVSVDVPQAKDTADIEGGTSAPRAHHRRTADQLVDNFENASFQDRLQVMQTLQTAVTSSNTLHSPISIVLQQAIDSAGRREVGPDLSGRITVECVRPCLTVSRGNEDGQSGGLGSNPPPNYTFSPNQVLNVPPLPCSQCPPSTTQPSTVNFGGSILNADPTPHIPPADVYQSTQNAEIWSAIQGVQAGIDAALNPAPRTPEEWWVAQPVTLTSSRPEKVHLRTGPVGQPNEISLSIMVEKVEKNTITLSIDSEVATRRVEVPLREKPCRIPQDASGVKDMAIQWLGSEGWNPHRYSIQLLPADSAANCVFH
jgi:hypothetical protein